jgi:hypothetical protein
VALARRPTGRENGTLSRSAETTQALFRIADSGSTAITPMSPYFLMALGFLQRYRKKRRHRHPRLWPGTDQVAARQAAADGFDGRIGVASIGQVIDLDR